MIDGFDFSELNNYEKRLSELALEQFPRESKSFLRKEGNKLKSITIKNAKLKVNKKTGNLFKGIARGKVYKYKEDEYAVRVYANRKAAHAHLLEYGHDVVKHNQESTGYKAREYKIFRDSEEEFKEKFYNDTKEFLYDIAEKL